MDAVNYYHGDIYFHREIKVIHPVVDGNLCKAVQHGFFLSNLPEPDHELVCTIEEFKQCVDDMAKAEWLNPGFACDYELHKNSFKPIARTEESTAIATLRSLGYTWSGGERWRPLIGEVPAYIKPKTHTVYEKVEFKTAWEALKMSVEEGLYTTDNNMLLAGDERILKRFHRGDEFARKVEKEITWQDELKEYLDGCQNLSKSEKSSIIDLLGSICNKSSLRAISELTKAFSIIHEGTKDIEL